MSAPRPLARLGVLVLLVEGPLPLQQALVRGLVSAPRRTGHSPLPTTWQRPRPIARYGGHCSAAFDRGSEFGMYG